jgi:predicted PurR-regulated permease PerM
MLKWLAPAIVFGLILYFARGVLSPFIIGGLLAYIFSPLVDQAQGRLRWPRLPVVAVFFVVLVGLLGFGIWLLETRLAAELRALSREGPDLVDAAFARLLGTERFQLFGQQVDPHLLAIWTNRALAEAFGTPGDALHVAERALDAVLKLFLTLLATFYLLLDGGRFDAYLLRFVAPSRRADVCAVADQIHLVLGKYLRGQLFLVALMSVVTYVVLAFGFHLPYALPIAIATGILEVIPVIGPITAGAIAAMVALVHDGPSLMIGVIVAYFALRMAEDQLVMPLVVGRAVHLHPLVTIFAVLLGSSAAGILGAILAVPVAAALRVTLDYAFPGEVKEPAPDGTGSAGKLLRER